MNSEDKGIAQGPGSSVCCFVDTVDLFSAFDIFLNWGNRYINLSPTNPPWEVFQRIMCDYLIK